MRSSKATRGTRRARTQLSFEALESRLLLAADTMAPLPPSLPPLANPEVFQSEPSAGETTASFGMAPHDRSLASLLQSIRDTLSVVGVRSFDGTDNNVSDPALGSVGQQLLRATEPDYGDGVSTPSDADRPSARAISNALSAQDEETANDRQMSAFIYAWGQFIDHDIDLSQPPETGGEAFPIAVPTGDEFFDPDGLGNQQISLTRTRFDATTGTGADNPREQFNEITAWIDGSTVYGSSQATADGLRAFDGGRLLTSDGDLPPMDDDGNFMAGDVRANENVELTAMHTLFIREHNFWAGQIAQQDPTLSDEDIFQQARAIVIAEIQSITFREFLPALLGNRAISEYQGYDPSVDPSIANEFSTAAFRMHTLINDDVEFFGNDGRAVMDEVALADAFFNPDLLRETGADSILKYLASTQSQEYDLTLVDSLRNFLFGQPGAGGFDLASLNIQRGRDHGLADYNAVREAYGLERAETFGDISSDPEIQRVLEELYGSVDNIDLWVGVLAEDHLPGSSVGELAQTIVADQFERLRAGDRFWYENVFEGRALRQIESTSLADIIARNTSIDNLQENVFFMQAEVSGKVFADGNENGRADRREAGLAGVTVELLNDEGSVVATTVTDNRGRYRFDDFRETGDYQLRVVLPQGQSATTPPTVEVLISAGGVSLRGIDFGVTRDGGQHDHHRDRHHHGPDHRADAVDAVFANDDRSNSVFDTPRRGGRR